MARSFDPTAFNRAYDEYIVHGQFQEVPEYYPRYRSRYRYLIEKFASHAPAEPCDVMDIGGGQLALLCRVLWKDRGTVADLPGPHFDYLKSHGLTTTSWNLVSEPGPFTAAFDAVFFSEVIEHVPIPGYIVLERIRQTLKPGGIVFCSTPNLFRLRNIVYLIIGKPIFDHFQYSGHEGLGHILEYSDDHLRWQFERAGFRNVEVELCELRHWPNKWTFKVLATIGFPLTWIPRFRGSLVAVGKASAK